MLAGWGRLSRVAVLLEVLVTVVTVEEPAEGQTPLKERTTIALCLLFRVFKPK